MRDDREARIHRLEQLEAIRRLKARYCRYSDEPELFDRLPDLFTLDGVLDEPPDDPLVGREAIRASIARYRETHRFSRHYATTPEIEIDGDRARGRWQALLISVHDFGEGPQPLWGVGEYREEYRLVDGEWRFARVEAVGGWMTAFDGRFEIPEV